MDALIVGISGIVIGWGLSFASNYFLNLQNHKHDITKQDSEHNYERRIFLRKKYEELVFRLINFSMVLRSLDFMLQQEAIDTNINIDGFIEKSG